MGAEDVRRRIQATLAAAYGEGLLSPGTLTHRLDELSGVRLIEPERLVGDLTLRDAPRWESLRVRLGDWRERLRPARRGPSPTVLALDWGGTTESVLLGRHSSCDVVLDDLTVSRRHAQLRFRDGRWVLYDLESTNGTAVNGAAVSRCQLRPGDRLALGDRRLLVD